MNPNWREFLSAQGASCANDQVRDFGNPMAERAATRDANVLVDLGHFALIRVTGQDCETFLNGQLTNDVRRVDGAHSQLSAWCNPKGRMLALFRIFRRHDALLLQLPASLRDDVLKRLRMYVLRAKVTLEDAADAPIRFGIAGPGAPASLQAAAGTAPNAANEVSVSDDIMCARVPGIHPRFELLVEPDRASQLWTALRRGAVAAGAEAWTWHDIMAGIPTVLPATSEAFIPQMTNLDLIGGISFDKGCYTGQEIVARLHYRGRPKQRMYRARTEADAPPLPADSIYDATNPDQSAGSVVAAAAAPEGGYELLAVLHCDSVASGQLHLHQPAGPRLTIESLPYALPV
jgi:folate-binding protein YgfZ